MQNKTLKVFQLYPFSYRHSFNISGFVSRFQNNLSLSYKLKGELEKLNLPSWKENPDRTDNLWQETCFEFFIKIQKSTPYWEFNLSPSGDWNVYHFTDYRSNSKEEHKFNILPYIVNRQNDLLELNLNLNLESIVLSSQVLDIAISTVTKLKDNSLEYWALNHPKEQADFHSTESFILELGCYKEPKSFNSIEAIFTKSVSNFR